jgi:ketol-acid reductoisomerase
MTDQEFEQLILKCYSGKTVAILGYQDNGGQQRAKFLRDYGIDVLIGLRIGDEHWELAKQDGFVVLPVWEAAEMSQVVQVW